MAPQGRIIDSQLSEHQDEGFLEGYVLTGRHEKTWILVSVTIVVLLEYC